MNSFYIRSQFGLLILLAAGHIGSASEDAPVPVRCANVVSQRASLGKAFVGSVEPARRSVIGTAVAGRVERAFVEPGDLVEQSGILIQLRLKAIQLKLAAAEAEWEASRQALAELKAGPREQELRRLDALVKAAKATLEYTTKHFDRLEDLSERGATSQVLLDEALSAKLAAEQRHVAAEAEYEAAVAGTRVEQIAQATAITHKVEEERNQIQDELEQHTIKAPFRGYIVKRLAEQGAWVQVGDPIAEIIELDPADVRVAVSEDYISRIQQGMQVRLEVESARTEETRTGILLGKIFRIVPDADSRTRSFPVSIRVENPTHDGQPMLKPGMLARVFLPVGTPSSVLLVPQDALVLDRNRAFVFILENRGNITTVRRVQVEAGAAQGNMIHVRPIGGMRLPENSQVVVEGNERLESGQAVAVLTD